MIPIHRTYTSSISIINCLVLILSYFLLINGCGVEVGNPSTKKPKSNTIDIATLISDQQLTSHVVNTAHGDAIAAAADQNASGVSLALLETDDDKSAINRSCAVSSDGLSAIVSVSSSISRTRTKTSSGGRVTVQATRTGSSSATRTWSRTNGTAVACNGSNTGAAVNFQSPDNLKLDISFERNRNDSISYSGPRVTRTATKSFTSSGIRSVTWGASDASGDGQTYVRNKSVVIKDVKQSLQMTNKNGESVATSLAHNTAQGAPIIVKVERNSSTHSVVSKTFVSGQIVTQKDSDASMTTTYNNLKLNFADNSCAISSGSAQIVIKDSSGTVLKTLSLGVDSSGDSALTDDSGNEVEGFALDPCDSEDQRL
jgi:hypothetical protein